MTASSRSDRPLPLHAPSAAETTRFPSAAAYAAALEAQALASAEEHRAHTAGDSPISLRELRVLLEENLTALRAVYEDQRRTIASALRAVDSARDELRALGQPDAPWIAALDETRGLIRAAFAEIAAHHATAGDRRR